MPTIIRVLDQIRLSVPDTPEMREVLLQVCGHAMDDNVPHHEDEAQDALASGDIQGARRHKALAWAWATLAETITATIVEGHDGKIA